MHKQHHTPSRYDELWSWIEAAAIVAVGVALVAAVLNGFTFTWGPQ